MKRSENFISVWKSMLAVGVWLALVLPVAWAQSNTPLASAWVTNGPVYAIEKVGDTVYLGGDFSYVGPNTGSGIALDAADGTLARNIVRFSETIYSCVSDGQGGWFVGGKFSQIGTQTLDNLAHVLPDGTLDPDWAPGVLYPSESAGAFVYALVLVGDTLYVGGDFTQVGGQTRNCLAALDAATGQLLDWNPSSNGIVYSLAYANSTLYVGGFFSSLGGQTRYSLGAVNPVTAQATSWNPSAIGIVYALCQTQTTTQSLIYAGGTFDQIGGQTRSYLAAVDGDTGLATDWAPVLDNQVRALAVADSVVYAGGLFTVAGGQRHRHLVALEADTAQPKSWNLDTSSTSSRIYALKVLGDQLYVGGSFGALCGISRLNLAAVNAQTGKLAAWNPGANGTCYVLADGMDEEQVFAGGSFSTATGKSVRDLVALNAKTGVGSPGSEMALISNVVYCIRAVDSTLYLGGGLRTVNGETRRGLAAMDLETGLLTDWNPAGVDGGTVWDIEVRDSVVYVAGAFSKMGGSARRGLAAVDCETGQALNWNPQGISTVVYDIALNEDSIYVGGVFSSMGAATRKNLAQLDLASGLASDWNPSPAAVVRSLLVDDSKVFVGFVGGEFTTIGGNSIKSLAAFDRTSGDLLTDWNPQMVPYLPNSGVYDLASYHNKLYAAGAFNSIGGLAAINVGQLNPDDATGYSDWTPNMNEGSKANCIFADDNMVYVGGSFEGMSGEIRPNFCMFEINNPASPSQWGLYR